MSQDYPRAIALYTKASQSTDTATRQEALEMLATARERNHQDAQAKVIYEQFLVEYPDSEAAPRIRQRLSGLLTRNLPVQKKLIKPEPGGGVWTAVGNVSQFYQRNEIAVNGDKPVTGVDGMFTNADVIVDRRSPSLDLGMRVSTNGLYDFGPDGDSTYQMSTAYLEAQQIDWGVDVRVGRQSQQSNGVLGRYDGAQIQYNVSSWLKVGAIGGYAVDYSSNAFSTDRPLYGVNAEISLADGMWEFAPFYIEQQANGLLDRRAVGMETRYFRDNMSAFSLLDYDTYHKALNTSYVMLNLSLRKRADVVRHVRSPPQPVHHDRKCVDRAGRQQPRRPRKHLHRPADPATGRRPHLDAHVGDRRFRQRDFAATSDRLGHFVFRLRADAGIGQRRCDPVAAGLLLHAALSIRRDLRQSDLLGAVPALRRR